MVQYTLWNTNVDLDLPKETFPTEDEMKKMDDNFSGIISEHGYFESPIHGKKLHYRKLLPPNGMEAKGLFVFQHGIMAECSMSHKEGEDRFKIAQLAKSVTEAGYIMYSLDMLGHGFSEGTRFYVPNSDWTVNRDDFKSFALFASKEEKPGLPFFIAGESYGGCLTIHISRQWMDEPESGPSNFKGMCLLAPAIIVDVPPQPVVLFLTSLAYLFPTWTPFFMPNTVSPERIWRNEKVRNELTSDRRREMAIAGGGRPLCLGTALGVLRSVVNVEKEVIPALTSPFFVAHGTMDIGVPVGGTQYLADKAKTPKKDQCVRIIEGGFHDLLSEDDREETAGALIDWMNTRI